MTDRITLPRATVQQALEALEGLSEPYAVLKAQDALRAALEQPEQEPVAWMYVGLTFNNDMHGPHLVWKPEHMDAMSAEKGVRAVPLYTHPPRREWRGLTEEDIWTLAANCMDSVLGRLHFARAIEATLKERNV